VDVGDYVCEVSAGGSTLDAGGQRLFVSNGGPEILLPLVLPQAMLLAEIDFLCRATPMQTWQWQV
jgi:hypothetical protein